MTTPEVPNAALKEILSAIPKPDVSAEREDKHAYALALSRKLAVLMASALRPTYPDVLPREDDTGHESLVGSAHGHKRLDVKVWDQLLGLKLLVSLKTYSFQDWNKKKQTAGRYSKNIQRNGKELKDEADVIHRRQPYAVMVAILFLPDAACLDGNPASSSDVQGPSSFASIVRRLRVRTGRAIDPDEKRFDRFDLSEKLYIGLYRADGEKQGLLRFFDVAADPPKNGYPADDMTLSLAELVVEMKRLVDVRNSLGIEWATLTEEIEEQSDDED